MIWSAIQSIKRFAILIPGLLIAILSWQDVFPYFHRRLPLALALFVTYILGAYVLIPALIRLIRLFLPASHLPLYCVTPDGLASDPLNVGLIGSRQQLIEAMQAAGWHLAGQRTPRNLIRHVWSSLGGPVFNNAPVSNLYLFGRHQDLAFQIPLGGHGQRHHVRFWAATYDAQAQTHAHAIQWHNRRAKIQTDKLLWLGAASRDTGLGLIRHNAQITHNVHPDTNRERELIIDGLLKAKKGSKLTGIQLGKPYRLANRVWRSYLNSDGRMTVLKLK